MFVKLVNVSLFVTYGLNPCVISNVTIWPTQKGKLAIRVWCLR
jgi:hypothetical protein